MDKPSAPLVLDAATLLDLDLNGIKLIEASAGTGKTHTIADLYLRYVLGGHQPAQILIVTYTNAATEELRGRIRGRLYQALRLAEGGPAEDEFFQLLQQRWQQCDAEIRQAELQRLRYALRSMDEASISTIHSFCQQALQEHALSGNQFFDSEMLDNDDPLWEAAVKDWWRRQTYRRQDAHWRLLQNQLPKLGGLLDLVLELRNRPGAELLPAINDDLESLLERTRSIADDLFALAPDWQRDRDDIETILSASRVLSRAVKLPYHAQNLDALLAAADAFFSADKPAVPFARFEYLSAACLDANSKPKSRGQDPGLKHAFFRALDDISADWRDLQAQLGPALRIDAYRSAALQVAELKRNSARLAFQDQLSMLLHALDSDRGEHLAQRLRQRYPIAMIDEFQDTDDIQYRIFSRIYLGAGDIGLTLIGDPKQAIYSFRGGDIFTYMRARRLDQVGLYSLPTNWRSHPDLVAAVNTLFGRRDDAFVYRDTIEFNAVDAVALNDNQRLRWQQSEAAPFTLWRLPQKADGGNLSRDQARERIYQAIAAEIGQMLAQPARIGDKTVDCGDIAVLVRTGGEGRALARVLNRHGIGTVTIGRDSVFDSDEARGLYDLLLAIAQYRDPAFASRSLASSLLALDYRQIAAIVDDDSRWQDWIERLARLQQIWERQGFIPMFQALLDELEITSQLARRSFGERRITNLLHLAELLQQQSSGGINAMLNWFFQQFDEISHETSELRLEGDEALVKIVTIHKSKGLQYPIVFVPFLWSCRPVPRDGAVYFHDDELRASIDLGSQQLAQNRRRAEKERLAEDLRLLYVALTRARAKLYLVWGAAGKPGAAGYSSETALAYLLHSRQTPADLDQQTPDGFPDAMDIDADLASLARAAGGRIEIAELPQAGLMLESAPGSTPPAPELAQFSRRRLAGWRINSFTSLTRGIHQPAHFGSVDSRGDDILDFPAGSHIGLLLHSLLEHLDFQGDIESQCESLFAQLLPVAGNFSDAERETLVNWLHNILRTPLDDGELRLERLAKRQRLNELEFDLALDQLNVDELNRVLQALTPNPLLPITGPGFQGLINGIIDLVFEHQGRYYLADYKSNFLGSDLSDYRPENLRLAMSQRRYDLQSLIYSIALHRMLQQRLPDYDYDSHFGGSYYLFLRAMRPQLGKACGVYFERPDFATIETVERLFAFSPAKT